MNKSAKLEILLVDDHPLFRKGVRSLLEARSCYAVIGEASNGREAVEFTRANRPAVIFMDIDMPGLSGIEAIRVLRKTLPDLKIIVLSTYTKKEYVQEAMMEGANGYVAKNTKIDELVKIIEDFAEGRKCYSPYLLNLAVKWQPKRGGDLDYFEHCLTRTEIRVLKYIAQGKTNSEIAEINFVSIETIKTHVQRIFKKLGVGNRMEAVAAAREKQIL